MTTNNADGQALIVGDTVIQLGVWNPGAGTFTDTNCAIPAQVNAVQVTTLRTINWAFAGLITGSPNANLSALALVLIGPVGSVPLGAGVLPLAVDNDKVPSVGQTIVIHLEPLPR